MEKPRPFRALAPALAAAGFACEASTLAAGPTFRTIALSGQPAPVIGPDVVLDVVASPRIDAAGRAVFWAELAGTGVDESNNASIWSDRSGKLEIVLREGDPAPLGVGSRWAGFHDPALSPGGVLGLGASFLYEGETVLDARHGLFTEMPPGGFAVVAAEGVPPPGGGFPFQTLVPSALSALGTTAFSADNGLAIWSDRSGATEVVVGAGGSLPGGPAEQYIDFLDAPAQASDGAVAFRASFAPAGERFPEFGWGLWVEDGASISPVAITGAQAPGTASGVVFDTLSGEPGFDDAHTVVFWASLTGDGVEETNDAGLWAGPAGAPALLAREGDPAPGTTGVFASFSQQIALAGGRAAFVAHIAGPEIDSESNSGLWRADPGGDPALVAVEGQQVPGLAAGIVFAGFGGAAINDAGELAFLARVAGPGVLRSSGTVLMHRARTGELRPLVRTGDLFDVSGDGSDVREVRDILFDPAPAGSGRSPMNDAGAVAFKLTFQDRTEGLFVALTCPADFDGDGVLGVGDFTAFRAAYLAGDPACDFNGNGSLDVGDFTAFRAAYLAGCP